MMIPKAEREAEDAKQTDSKDESKAEQVPSEEDREQKRGRWLMLLHEAEVIAANLKESGTRR